jgi:hypothetical protein
LSVEDEQSSTGPIVGCEGPNVYVFWGQEDFGTLFRISTDGGSTWGSIDSTLQGEGYQDVFVINDTLFLAGGRNPGDIIFRKSTDGGNTWLPVKLVGYGAYVRQAVSPPIIGFVYQVSRYSEEVMFKRSKDSGTTWLDSLILSHHDSISSFRPRITSDTLKNVHVVWTDYKYSPYLWTGDVFYRTSGDTGSTWEEIDSLTMMHRAVWSEILVESNNLHLVWEDDRHDFNDNFEIYYRMSTDLGQTWGPEVRLTDTLNWSRRPFLACSGRYLHLFWFDLRDDTSNIVGEIYYKRKDLLVPTYEENRLTSPTKSKFEAYPNPFRTDIRLRITDDRYKEIENIRIFDILGKEVIAYEVKNRNQGVKVDTANLPCGVYFIQIKVCKKSVIKKVLKIK